MEPRSRPKLAKLNPLTGRVEPFSAASEPEAPPAAPAAEAPPAAPEPPKAPGPTIKGKVVDLDDNPGPQPEKLRPRAPRPPPGAPVVDEAEEEGKGAAFKKWLNEPPPEQGQAPAPPAPPAEPPPPNPAPEKRATGVRKRTPVALDTGAPETPQAAPEAPAPPAEKPLTPRQRAERDRLAAEAAAPRPPAPPADPPRPSAAPPGPATTPQPVPLVPSKPAVAPEPPRPAGFQLPPEIADLLQRQSTFIQQQSATMGELARKVESLEGIAQIAQSMLGGASPLGVTPVTPSAPGATPTAPAPRPAAPVTSADRVAVLEAKAAALPPEARQMLGEVASAISEEQRAQFGAVLAQAVAVMTPEQRAQFEAATSGGAPAPVPPPNPGNLPVPAGAVPPGGNKILEYANTFKALMEVGKSIGVVSAQPVAAAPASPFSGLISVAESIKPLIEAFKPAVELVQLGVGWYNGVRAQAQQDLITAGNLSQIVKRATAPTAIDIMAAKVEAQKLLMQEAAAGAVAAPPALPQ